MISFAVGGITALARRVLTEHADAGRQCVDTVLIAGIDTVVGANLASVISQHSRVVGLCLSDPISLAECETSYCPRQDVGTIRKWVASVRPERIVYCGASARTPWHDPQAAVPAANAVEIAANWSEIATEFGAQFTVVTSDAVFTGPWLFHAEDSNCKCDSAAARRIQQIEKATLRTSPDALVVRTHVFGWSFGQGWIEQIIDDLDAGIAGPYEYQCHSTPILATDFAEILEQAWQAGLQGTYHIAGAERLNPNQFVHRLAGEFGLSSPHSVNGNSLTERPTGFGRGESSLHTTKIRQALDVSMPTISDSLERLREQRHNGYCERLKSPAVLEKVA